MPLSLRNLTRSAGPFALAFVLLGLSGCGEQEGQAAGRPGGGKGPGGGGRPDVPVAIELVSAGAASSYYTATATLEAVSHARILARTTGVVREILGEEGDLIAAGEALLQLDDEEARWRVKQAEANQKAAWAEYERRQQMEKAGLLSAGEFEATVNNLRVREADLELTKLELGYTRVQSPIEGRVVRRFVDLGAHVTPGMPLFEVMDVMPLLARVYIPAKRMGFVEVGQAMEIRLESASEALSGTVSLVSPIVDPTTGTVKVTAEIHRYPPGTRAGDFAQVRIVTARRERATLVPSRSVFEEQGDDVLFVVEDGKAVRRVVEKGFIDGDFTEILAGVESDELVVVKGQRQLRDGAGVQVLEGPPEILAELEKARTESEATTEAETETADAS